MSTPKQIARGLLRENRKNGTSWRTLGKRMGVNHATLCRFAKSKGRWRPKDKTIQAKLGILKARKVQPKMITKIVNDKTGNELIKAFTERAPMKGSHSRVVLAFKENEWWISVRPAKAGTR